MTLLFDIGNTNTHLGIGNASRVFKQANIPTASWFDDRAKTLIAPFIRNFKIKDAAFCSVVPRATEKVRKFCRSTLKVNCFELNSRSVQGIGIDYPKPKTIGPDRLANAIAIKNLFGSPAVVVDFGTAVTFDVVDAKGNYVGGIIAPGLAAMTDYLHEKTALLPKIQIRETSAVIGKNTEQAMLIGAVHGYRGLIRELLNEVKRELKTKKIRVVATGGYAGLIARKLPEIESVQPLLTLEGLRLCAIEARQKMNRVRPT
jgi:type III pantothenate kinase